MKNRIFENFPSLVDADDEIILSGRIIFRMDEEDLIPTSEWSEDGIGDITFRLARETEIGSFYEGEDDVLIEALYALFEAEFANIFGEYDLEFWPADGSEHTIVGFQVGDKEKATLVWNRIKETLIEHGAFEVYDV